MQNNLLSLEVKQSWYSFEGRSQCCKCSNMLLLPLVQTWLQQKDVLSEKKTIKCSNF